MDGNGVTLVSYPGARFLSLSVDGSSFACGYGTIYVDGVPIGEGRYPVFQRDGSILCAAPELGLRRYVQDSLGRWRSWDFETNAAANVFTANRNGHWAYYTTIEGPRVVTWLETFVNYADVAIGPEGEVALKRWDNGGLVLYKDKVRTVLQPADVGATLDWSDGGLTWTSELPRPQPYVLDLGARPFALRPREWAVTLARDETGERYGLTSTDDTLLIRAIGATVGVALPSLQDARLGWLARERCWRVVGWNVTTRKVDSYRLDPRKITLVSLTETPVPVNSPKPEVKVQKVKDYPPESWITDKVGSDVGEWAEKNREALTPKVVQQAVFIFGRACARTIQDFQNGMSLDSAVLKHRNEARREVGLDPL